MATEDKPTAPQAAKMLKQLEFYFSDSNYPKDKFLRGQAAENEEGFVALSKIVAFKRMAALGATVEALAEVARQSPALEVNKDGTMVKRTKPLPEDDDSLQRSLYTKGWPEDATIDEVEAYFSKYYGKVNAVRLRRRKDRKQKDSIFVEFEKLEVAQAANADAARPSFKDKAITTQMRADYHQVKKEQRKQRMQEIKNKRKQPADSTAAEEGSAAKKAKTNSGEAAAAGSEEGSGQKGEKEEEAGDDEEQQQQQAQAEEPEAHPVGVVVRFTGVGAGVDREAIKSVFVAYGNVQYVDFQREATDGFVRFAEAAEAQRAVAGVPEAKVELGGKVPELAIVSGDAEEEYWKRVRESRKARSNRGGSKRGGGRGGGRGGSKRGGGRGRGRGGRGGKASKQASGGD